MATDFYARLKATRGEDTGLEQCIANVVSQEEPLVFPGFALCGVPLEWRMRDELLLYKDLTTATGYIVAWRDRLGVAIRDLDSSPGDQAGLIVVSEWTLWQAVQTGRWERHIC